jgi:hypothetical protein
MEKELPLLLVDGWDVDQVSRIPIDDRHLVHLRTLEDDVAR